MSCSFCSSRLHDIRGCRDPTIDLLFERIKVTYIDIMNQYPNDIEVRFKSVLNTRFNLRQLRAVCATRTNYPSSRTKSQIINALYQYYRTRIYNLPQQDEQRWLEVRRLPTQPDPIPDFARDLEEQQETEEEPDITWYIDTTPSPVSIFTFATLQESSRQNIQTYNVNGVESGIQRVTGPTRLNDNQGIEPIPASELIHRFTNWLATQRNGVVVNLNSEFDAVATAPQIKKYNIKPKLVLNEVEEGIEECAICYESINCVDLVKLNCKHKFCGSCITKTLKHHNGYDKPSCAFCREPMITFNVKNPEIYNLVSEYCNI